jgi:hypothetical protein
MPLQLQGREVQYRRWYDPEPSAPIITKRLGLVKHALPYSGTPKKA